MEIILLEDVEALGNAGEIVKVKPGYCKKLFVFAWLSC